MAAVVKEPAPRIVSPVFLVLAGLCFLLPFAGVSCNTSGAAAELQSVSSISQLGGQGSAALPAGLTGCLNSLNDYTWPTTPGSAWRWDPPRPPAARSRAVAPP
ncbi:MAG: hypothetical protein ABR950_01725 [Candidatus Dormibacteria bacterium]|jgi:hypothetical protein